HRSVTRRGEPERGVCTVLDAIWCALLDAAGARVKSVGRTRGGGRPGRATSRAAPAPGERPEGNTGFRAPEPDPVRGDVGSRPRRAWHLCGLGGVPAMGRAGVGRANLAAHLRVVR